jgi:phospholipid/cholesterol/gamma-HCH transport system permease protein
MTTPYVTSAQSSTDASRGVQIGGDWTLAHYSSLEARLPDLRAQVQSASAIDLRQLAALDTAGAALVEHAETPLDL